jgi:hypothetical protein
MVGDYKWRRWFGVKNDGRSPLHPAAADQAPDGLCGEPGCGGWWIGRIIECPKFGGCVGGGGGLVSVPHDLALDPHSNYMRCPIVAAMIEGDV